MNSSDKTQYRFALVLLTDDMDSAGTYFAKHKELLSKKELQTVFVVRSGVEKDEQADVQHTAEGQVAFAENVECHLVPAEYSADDAYNASLALICADYVCFTNTDICYDNDFLQGVDKALASFPGMKLAVLNYKKDDGSFSKEKKHKKPYLITMEDQESITLFPYAYFFDTKSIGDTRFHSACEEESALIFLLEMLQKAEQMVCADTYTAYYNEKINYDPANIYGCMSKSFYIPSVEENYLPLLQACADKKKAVPGWLQRSIVYLLYFKIFSNYNRRDRFVLLDYEKEEFFAAVSKVLQFVDDDHLIRRMHYKKHFVQIPVVQMLVSLKYKGDARLIDKRFYIKDQTLYMQMAGKSLSLKNEQRIVMQAINVEKEDIVFDAYFHTYALFQYAQDAIHASLDDKLNHASLDDKLIHASLDDKLNHASLDDKLNHASLDDKMIHVEPIDIFSHEKTFGVSIDKKYTFRLRVKKEHLWRDGTRLSFILELGGEREALPIVFNKQASRLDETCRHTYWQMDRSFILLYDNPCLSVKKVSTKELRQQEKALLSEQLAKVTDPEDKEMMPKLLKDSFRDSLFGKKKIQIYFDKLYKAGDNGDYQFRYDYAHQKEDGTECYYILHPDSRYYGPMKEEFGNHILEYNSFRARYIALRASLVFATASNVFQILGFDGQMNRFFRNRFQGKIVCLYHGITMQKIAEVQHRLLDNVRYQFVTSKYEAEQLCKGIYGYQPEQILLTGMSRYDGLRLEDKKIILLAPTWRPNLATKLENRKERKHSDTFKDSVFFRIYNQLINDSTLIDSAKKNGYRIIFLLHTGMTAQIEDYDQNEYVEILRAGIDIEYEDILSQASLMVTDYSGIQYDFAFMRKPIIYYHPGQLPPTYQNGGMDYESMGFGPVIHDHAPLVQAICQRMEQNCALEERYRQRQNDFFAYQDQNNCKRIHDYLQTL